VLRSIIQSWERLTAVAPLTQLFGQTLTCTALKRV
jgi:hypothetical protein